MSSESKITVVTNILGREYETAGTATATATANNSEQAQIIADNASRFIATEQAKKVAETNQNK